jgi:hypothetical protein
MKVIAAFAVLCLLLASTEAITTYNFDFDTLDPYSYNEYYLGYQNGGTTVRIDAKTPGTRIATNELSIEIKHDDGTVISCVTITGCTAGNENCTCDMVIAANRSGVYRLKVSTVGNFPANANVNGKYLQLFYLDVTSYLTSSGSNSTQTSILKVTDTFRDRLAKLIYLSSPQNLTFSIYSPDNTATNRAKLALYSVSAIEDSGATYNINASLELASNVSIFTQVENFTSGYESYTSLNPLPIGYYVMVIRYNHPYNLISFQFPSDSYPCPYNLAYPDFYQNFQPCSPQTSNTTNVNAQAGFPCLVFDSIALKCLNCSQAAGYILVNGACQINDACPARTYFHFGQCLPVSERCATFNAYSNGECTSCQDPTDSIVSGVCSPTLVFCQPRQFQVNRTCFNVSNLCDAYNATTGACTTCIANFQVLNGSGVCTPIVITCNARQYLVNRTCVDVPALCNVFDNVTLRCGKCQRGYWPSLDLGVCQKVLCPPRQVPSEFDFFCVQVSDLCATFDELTGDCLTCKDQGYTIQGGKCLQAQPLAGCKEREQLGFGPCVNASQNCAQYSLVTGDCQQCLSGWYFDYTGRCMLQNQACQADEVSIQGICMRRPNNCAQVDATNGLCAQCNPNYRLNNGQCTLIVTCPAGQYLTDFGQCVNVAAGCAYYNPTSGVCLRCSDGSSANNGICCAAGFVVYQSQCVDSLTYKNLRDSAQASNAATCVTWHPTLKVCIE